MAIHDGRKNVDVNETAGNATQENVADTMNQGYQNRDAGTDVSTALGFDGSDIFTMSSNLGSDYTIAFAKEIMESYKNIAQSLRPRVSVIDKEVTGDIAWSTLVISKEYDGIVNYFIVLLEATGRAPLKASEVINEVNSVSKVPGAKPNLFTADDAIDDIMHDVVIRALEKEYGEENLTL